MNALKRVPDRRAVERSLIFVPASVLFGEVSFTATLLNIGSGGALIQTNALLPVHSRIKLRCGTIDATAFVVWRYSDRCGVKFVQPLKDSQLIEQISRTAAVKSRAPELVVRAPIEDHGGHGMRRDEC